MELKDILEFIGISDAKNIDEFKTKFAEKWNTEDTFFSSKAYNDKIGKINGSLISKAKAISKQFGVEFTGAEIDGKKIEEIYELGFKKLQELNNTAMEAVKTAGAGTSDEKYKNLETTHLNLSRDFKTLEENNKKIKSDWDADKQTSATQLKGAKLKFLKDGMFAKFPWGTDDELNRKGFVSIVDEEVNFDLDDKDELIVLDRKTGQKINNPKQHSSFLSPEEYLMARGVEKKVVKINPDGGKPAGGGSGASAWGSGKDKQEGAAGTGEKPKNVLASNTYNT